MNDFAILNELSTYGPLMVLLLLLLPLGEDLIIIPAGFLVGQNPDHFPFWPTFLCAYVGSLMSDGMWYFACYRFGTPLLHKRWFKRLAHPRRLLQAKHQVEKRGAWLIVTARFVPGSRTSAMIASGLLHMPVWKFAVAECICLFITVPMQLGLGWLISHHIGSTNTAGKVLTIVGVVAALTMGAFIWNWVIQHRKSQGRAPRSKAAWLRRFRRRKESPEAQQGNSRGPARFKDAASIMSRKHKQPTV
jgi:membrane protein DedA with SNARE-associated domain